MIPLSAPSRTKYAPTMEARMQMAPMPSGKIITVSRIAGAKKIALSSMVATMVTT
jgi:hypothetical protein